MINIVGITLNKELGVFLDDYAEEVRLKNFERTKYEKWKKLSSFRKYIVLEMRYSAYYEEVLLTIQNPVTCKQEKMSIPATIPFGQYLIPFIIKEKNIPMDTVTTETTSTFTTKAIPTYNGGYTTIDYLTSSPYQYIDTGITLNTNTKEKEKPMDLFKNFSFGSCENDNVKVSMYGVAVKNANGSYVSYDSATNSVIDVDILNFDAKYLYKMPVAIKDIAVGDTIIHNKVPMFVTKIEDSRISVVDPKAGEEKTILPTKSMFGFDFVTKIINLFSNFMNAASADQPFGNMLPMLLASENNDPTILLLAASGGKEFDMTNPMFMYFMAKNSGADMLPLFLLMNQTKK